MHKEINYERLAYDAAWTLYDVYYQQLKDKGFDDFKADQVADEMVCNALDISIGQYGDIIEMW